MAPILASRSALRRKMKESMRRGESPRDFWSRDATRADLFFSEGHTFRERNDGRIDMRVGFEPPFNASDIAANSFAFPVLTRVLGQDLRLKSIHAIQALPKHEGASTEPQHWHRDTGLLFPDDDFFHIRSVHNKTGGLHLPSYAVNQFVTLVDSTATSGPTEFTLGSHQWGTRWSDDEADPTVTDTRFFVKKGSVVLSDYRTVHRGTVNTGSRRRPLGMLIWGRPWWSDTVNYPSACSDETPSLTNAESLPQNMRSIAENALAPLLAERSGACREPPPREKRANFWRIAVNGWGKSLARELHAEAH